MKENTHPEYRDVLFIDMSSGKKYLCGSSVKTTETAEYEGQSYPSVKVSISSSSHPFFTGDSTFVDTEGRVDKFKKRYAAKASSGKKTVSSKSEASAAEEKKKPASKDKNSKKEK